MNTIVRLGLACWLCAGAASGIRAGTATFDDLPTPPPTDGATGLEFTNGGSLVYQGVAWDSRVTVVGDGYQVSPPNGPTFGIPHSGRYFVTNQGDGSTNDGILLTTNQVLLGAWFGRNEYYGFGSGSTQVTIIALQGATELASAAPFDLPAPSVAGQPGEMGYYDTGIFAGLAGRITGYRIDRASTNPDHNGNWTADDFKFALTVPEPSSIRLVGLGLIVAGVSKLRNSTSRRRLG